MKRLLIIVFALVSLNAASQNSKVTFVPKIFTADDEVIVTVDISGTALSGTNEAYFWAFSNTSISKPEELPLYPKKDAITNGQWTASDEKAKMTKVSADKWKYTFTGTTLFELSPGQLKDLGFLLKTKDGSKQTTDYKPFSFDPVVFTPTEKQVFPVKASEDDLVTIFFDQKLSTIVGQGRMTPNTIQVTIYGMNDDIIGTPKSNLPLRKEADGTYSFSFISNRLFEIPAGVKVKKFTYQFSGTGKDEAGNTIAVTTDEGSYEFLDLQ